MVDDGMCRIHLIEAKLTHETDRTKMDPYVLMSHREYDWKSPVLKHAGNHPKWEEGTFFEFKAHYFGDEIHMKVMDYDMGSKDDLVGSTSFKLSSICIDGGFDDWW